MKIMIKRIMLTISAIIMCCIISACAEKTDPVAERMIQDINSIGTVTLEDGKLISEIEAGYSVMTDKQKNQVTNYITFIDAKKAYNELAATETVKQQRLNQIPKEAAAYGLHNYIHFTIEMNPTGSVSIQNVNTIESVVDGNMIYTHYNLNTKSGTYYFTIDKYASITGDGHYKDLGNDRPRAFDNTGAVVKYSESEIMDIVSKWRYEDKYTWIECVPWPE